MKDASGHKALIALQGADYTSAVWVTASDGHGGTTVHDPSFISGGDGFGNATIGDGGQLELGAGASSDILFAGNSGKLTLDQSQNFLGKITGFGGQDQIDLLDLNFGPNTTLGFSANSDNSGGTLTLSDGLHSANLALMGQYAAGSFAMASDGHGGFLVTDVPLVQQWPLTQPQA